MAGSDLKVKIVANSNPTFLDYEVDLKHKPETDVNTYEGKGFFVAKLKSGKECKFETEWQVVVVQPVRIFGKAMSIIPNQDTCEVQDKDWVQLDLKKVP